MSLQGGFVSNLRYRVVLFQGCYMLPLLVASLIENVKVKTDFDDLEGRRQNSSDALQKRTLRVSQHSSYPYRLRLLMPRAGQVTSYGLSHTWWHPYGPDNSTVRV